MLRTLKLSKILPHQSVSVAKFSCPKLEQQELAEKDLSKALSLNPNVSLAYANRANVWVALTQFEKARDDFSKAIILTPDDPFLYFQRGGIYATTANNSDAASDFQVALTKGLSDGESLKIILFFAVNTNNIDLQIAVLLKMKEVNPPYARV